MEKKSRLFIETYGCQMNFSDSEIVGSVMTDAGYELTTDLQAADVVFVNTCSIRDNAEQRVRKRLRELQSLKKKKPGLIIGLLGCMAERVKEQLFDQEQLLDLIAGPDAYRDLPRLMDAATEGQKAINLILSADETYADISPVRLDGKGVSAFISIMRGCENFCSYCVVPYTRGTERSRDPETVLSEARGLFEQGYREITLLGQNVNSYHLEMHGKPVDFPYLLAEVAGISPLLRLRFATSHPKDLSDKLIHTIAAHPNICRSVHLPVQSGSNFILWEMNRNYTREWYLDRIHAIRAAIPDCTITTDIITGFCGETEADHLDTLSLMREVHFDHAYMFRYSERPGTLAAQTKKDDVPGETKSRRLNEIIQLQNRLSLESNRNDMGNIFEVLVEGHSKRSREQLSGRTSQNKMVVFPGKGLKPGDYTRVKITSCTSATLLGEVV
ncbi:MAG TPA: tRNA (N6-isopentenyl adenosine(37)-C2)-methylthiotransferase MiaB [Bacteroidales bacterium]|nr:tRNA (N6-isopentenyl adenosine(37)-C2)-methylthiotransferase MiaB [Bacteroidales bacterium]